MPACDILFAMTGDVSRNSRALRQIRALTTDGLSVHLVSLDGGRLPADLVDQVEHTRVPDPKGRGIRYFMRIHGTFSNVLTRIDARLIHASDLYVLTACRRRAVRKGAALTYDARELYGHVATTRGRPWVRWVWSQIERASIRKADRVFTVSESIAARLASTCGIERPMVVYNAPSLDPSPEHGPGIRSMIDASPDTSIIVHLGQMRRDRGCAALVEAMALVPEAHLVFLGYGPLEAELKTLSCRLEVQDRVSFCPPVAPSALRSALSDSTIGVTMLEDTCLNHRFALPNKLFDYLAAGLPVLGADLPEIRRILTRFDCGLTANPTCPESIAEGLKSLLDGSEYQERALRARSAAQQFDWSNAAAAFVSRFRELLDEDRR